MPFVQNNTAYVTGEVPARDLKRLNGEQSYTRRTERIVCGILPLVLLACAGLSGMLAQSGSGVALTAMILSIVAAISLQPVWNAYSPRVLNRSKWNEYRAKMRLFKQSDAIFRIVMSPEVVAALNSNEASALAVTAEVDKLLEWYAVQRVDDVARGPIATVDAPLLAELRYKLEVGVGGALHGNAEIRVLASHVDSVLISLRETYLRERELNAQQHRLDHEEAEADAKYQRGQLSYYVTEQ